MKKYDMKIFNDLTFHPHELEKFEQKGTLHAMCFFPNGYGVSVLFGDAFYSNGVDTYELAVLKGNKDKFSIAYDTPITNDVLAYITKEEVTEAMRKVQQLPSTTAPIMESKAELIMLGGKIIVDDRCSDMLMAEKTKTKKEMKREIKYRGKDIENNQEWRIGSLIETPDGECIIVLFDKDGNELSYDVDPDTVGQFTGLKDGKGKEIYEGDIIDVKFGNNKDRCICAFEDGAFALKYLMGGSKSFSDEEALTGLMPFVYWNMPNTAVVGNIHDNPEMI